MKNLTPYLIITILVLIILLMLKDCKGKPDTETEYVYKTDSLYKDKYFKLKEEFDKKTPPKTVTIWKQSPPKIIIDSIKYVPGEILVYIEGLKETLRIKEDYIKLYPHNDKLLEFNLTRDKLDITTLNTDAQIITKEYPLFLNKYKYR